MTRGFYAIASILAVAAVYFCAGKFGLSLAFVNASASAVWPPAGIALAALLLWGNRLWPGVFIGAFLVNITTQGSLITTLGIATGNTLEALVGAWLVCRFANGTKVFERAQDVFKFVVLIALVSTPISAILGVTSLCLTGFARWPQYLSVWLTWWLGNLVSDLIIAPLIVIWATRRFERLTPWRAAEWVGLMASMLVVAGVVFLEKHPFGTANPPLGYLAVLPLLWAAFRFGKRSAIAAAFLLSGIALGGTLHHLGPFAEAGRNESLLLLQAYIGTITVTALVLASVVSERRRVVEDVRQSEERFRQVTENISEVFWMSDVAKNRILYISPAYESIWGRSRESLYASARDWVEAIHPGDRERVLEAALTRQASGQFNEIYRITRPDKSTRWIRDRAFPVRDESGEVYRIVGIAEDITERKRSDDDIATLAHAVESTSELICITDSEDRFVFVNRAFQEAYGYTETEIRGKKPEILFSPNNPPELMQQILKRTRAGGWRGEVLDRRKDGTEFPVFLSTSQIWNRNGQVIGLMGVAQDISERKRAESRMQELAAIIEGSDDAICSMTLEGTITNWNKAAERVYGFTAEEITGRSILTSIPPDRPNEMMTIIERLKRGERLVGLETTRRRKDGSLIDVSLTVSPVRDDFARIIGGSVITRDITQRKLLERELLKISAEERRRVGHELHDGLGQYLAGVALKAKVLEESLAADQSVQALRAKEVVTLVNNAIRQTRSLAQGLDPIHVEANGAVAALQNLTAQIQDLFRVQCVFVCASEHLPINTQCGLTFYRITQEAVHNAITHGEAQHIDVELALDDAQVRLSISDNGKGFELDRPLHSGMGLHIMEYRANSIGGRLVVRTGPGKGSRIELLVPRHLCVINQEEKPGNK